MTGFATVSEAGFTLTAKGVNHRFLDLQVRVPMGADSLEAGLRSVVRANVKRGHVELTLDVERSVGGSLVVRRNDELLGALVKAYREAAELHGVTGEPDLNGLLRVPGVMTSEMGTRSVDVTGLEAEVYAAGEVLMGLYNDARAAEGASLASGMHVSMERLLELTAEMAGLRAGVAEAHMSRLRARLAELLEGVTVSEDRLLTEAAMLVDRSDVEEEIVRMGTHARQFRAILDEGGEVGKRLDFLLQEMNRGCG
jgi:uncharacterized protein (TIGR00255 family)